MVEENNCIHRPASIKDKISATVIDWGFLLLLFIPIYFVDYFTDNAIHQGQVIGSLTTLYLFSWFFVFTFYDSYAVSEFGYTIGQKLTHIKVQTDTQSNPSFEQLIARKALSTLLVPVIWEAFDENKQGLHDKFTHIEVVEEDDYSNESLLEILKAEKKEREDKLRKINQDLS